MLGQDNDRHCVAPPLVTRDVQVAGEFAIEGLARGIVGRPQERLDAQEIAAPGIMTVFDQLPVSREKDMEVHLLGDSTAPSQRAVEDRPGVLAWQLDVEPGKSGQVRFGYEVSYPEGKTVPGL